MENSVDPDQTAPIGAVCSGSTIGAVCSGSTLFVSILNSSVMLGNYLQQTTSADDIFRCIFFLGAVRVKIISKCTFGTNELSVTNCSSLIVNGGSILQSIFDFHSQ